MYSDIENKKEIKASDLAQFYWCAEQSYWRCRGIYPPIKPCQIVGSKIHKEVVRPPKEPWEIEFFELLENERPFCKIIEDIKIFAGIDAIDSKLLFKKIVRLIENKTTKYYDISYSYLSPAQFQLEIYYWIFKPIIKRINYKISDIHYVKYFNSDSRDLFKIFEVKMNLKEIEQKIRNTVVTIKTGNNILPPKPWKCKLCDNEFKSRCRWRGIACEIK